MASGSQGLETLRGCIEASEGGGGPPTRLLYVPQGSVALTLKNEPIKLDLAWAKQDKTQTIIAGMETDGIAFSGVPVSFHDFGWWLSMFDAALGETPTGPTDTTAYTRTGAPSQTDSTWSATGVRSAYFQFGANDLISTVGWALPGCIGETLTVNWKKRSSGNDTGMMFDAAFMTPKAASQITSFTGALSDTTPIWVVGNNLKSYVDTSTIATTADANITEAQFTLTKHNAFHDGLDNTGTHTSMHRPSGWDTQLTYTRKFADKVELDAYAAKTLRKVEIIAEGALAGAATAKNTVKFDFVGKYTDMGDVPTYVDGMWYQTFTLDGVYDSGLSASWKFTLINAVAVAYKTA